MQYSTPCFAWAASLCVQTGVDDTLLDPASRALTFALTAMVNGSSFCAQATCDFYAVPVLRAYLALRTLAGPATVASWTTLLQSLDPAKTYELTGQNWELTAAAGEFIRMQQLGFSNGYANWSYWEARIGRLATLGTGGGFWEPNGQFQDNYNGEEQQIKTSPHAYDAFADGYTTLLLHIGYNSSAAPEQYPYAPYLGELMSRGVWTHALFQGPWGEIPVGGRSGQHQWNEALMAAQYELNAVAAMQAGDEQAACMLRRSARLSHASLRRWIREDGALQIVKNWVEDPTQRWGYESYSFFSQYNLLPMAWLANAYEAATDDDSILECATLADVGGVAFALPYSSFRKVFASTQGTYVEVMTGADPEYDSTGFYRVQFKGCAAAAAGRTSGGGAACPTTLGSLVGPTAAPPLNGAAPFNVATAIGGVWWNLAGDAPGTRHSLANHTLATVLASVFSPGPSNSPAQATFTVQYVLWGDGILVTEVYNVSPGLVQVTTALSVPGAAALFHLMASAATGTCASSPCTLMPPASPAEHAAVLAGDVEALLRVKPSQHLHVPDAPIFTGFGVQFPAFLYDGRTNYTVAVDPAGCNCTTVDGGAEGAVAYTVHPAPGRALSWAYNASLQVASRNGVVSPVYASEPVTGNSPSISFSVSVLRAAAAGA
jgi:hypothetical protein